MQIVDKDGNIFGNGLEVTGPDGKPKTTGGGGGSPTGPAGGDLYGTYPNPGVDWNLGISTYNMYFYPLTNPNGYISGITSLDVTTALGYTPYDSSNPAGYLNAISGSMVTSALGYLPYDSSNPAGYIDSSALTPYLTSAAASSTYQTILVSGTSIKTVNSTSLLGSGDVAVQPTLVSGTNIKTVNGNSLLGSGDVTISSNPRLLGFSGINGTNTSSNTVTVCHSLLIPANTLTTNSILQLVFRMNRVSGNTGQMYGRIYFNTSNSLSGASLFNTIFTMNGGSTQFLGYVERNFSYDGTNLTSYSNTAYSEYTTGAALSVAFNRTVNNWVLFTMQAQSASEIANINLFKVFAYV